MAAETDYGIFLNVGTLLGLVSAVAAGVWKFSRIEKAILDAGHDGDKELRTEMDAKFEDVSREIIRVERDGATRAEQMRHETGEVGAALRAKLHEMEVFGRDNFVSNKNFDTAVNRIEGKIDKLGDRLEAKIDRIGQRD